MAYFQLFYHLIIRTYRSGATIPEEYEKELYMHIYNYAEKHECKVYRINGMPDHVHIFLSIPPKIAISDFAHNMKLATSKSLKYNEHFPDWEGWGESFGVISYCIRDKEMLINYIKNQKEHHKKVSTLDEIMTLYDENQIEYDKKFIQY